MSYQNALYDCDAMKYNGEYYMFPETYTAEEVRVYKAEDFPYDWKHVSTIAKGRPFVDPSVFRYNDTSATRSAFNELFASSNQDYGLSKGWELVVYGVYEQ